MRDYCRALWSQLARRFVAGPMSWGCLSQRISISSSRLCSFALRLLFKPRCCPNNLAPRRPRLDKVSTCDFIKPLLPQLPAKAPFWVQKLRRNKSYAPIDQRSWAPSKIHFQILLNPVITAGQISSLPRPWERSGRCKDMWEGARTMSTFPKFDS